MNTVKILFIVLLLLILAIATSAQSSRRKRAGRPVNAKRTAVTPTQPAAIPVSSESAPAPVLLATVNGQNITTADIDPKVHEQVEALDARIAAARKQILELQINTLLLEGEASKRKLTPQQLYNIEVAKKVTEPAAAEVNKFIENNRDQIEETDPVAMREQVVSYLRGEREAKLSEELVKRLRDSNDVVISVQDTSNLPPSTVVATVAGRPLTAGIVNERLKPIVYKLRLQTYLLEQPALDLTINDLLLIAEANRRNVAPEEIVRKEITEKIHPPTDDEIAKFYSGNKARIPGELAAVRNQIASYLQDEDRQRLDRAMSDRLRKGSDIRLLISEPEPPLQSISLDDDPARGDATAPVTIVEFTDFQCPACAAMQPVIEEILKSYGNRVRLVVRDFPLQQHNNARKAAEAANAANAQGRFFEYAALLFKRQNALDVPSLKKYASELGLDRARFDAALDGGKFAAEVKHDIDDGQMYGVESTPTIFINGITLRELSGEALRAAIDRGLARSSSAPKVSAK